MKGGKPKSQAKNAALSVNKKAAAATKGRQSTKKDKQAKDPNKPKRPPSAFFVFMEEFRVQYKEKHPQNKAVSVVGKAGGDKWKSLSDAEKAPFIAKVKKRKADYEKSMKAYNKKQDNPSASSLRGKICLYWDDMNTLWSSSRAIGNTSITATERCTRLDSRFTEMSYEQSYQSTHNPNDISTQEAAGSSRRPVASSSQGMPDVFGSHPSASSGKSRSKRKSSSESVVDAVITNFQTCVADLGRAMCASADRIASKEAPRPYQYSIELFKAIESLHLPQDYLLEAYEFLSEHKAKAHMFLGATEPYRATMLDRIMKRV